MNTQPDNPPACARCGKASVVKQGRIWLCQKHYRFGSMRAKAKRSGQYVPSNEELEAMANQSMDCIGCGRRMTWGRDLGASRQATLQHDRLGGTRLLCLGCNTRHAVHDGDSFYHVPKDYKHCPDCKRTLPREMFCRDNSRPVGLKSYCRRCSSERNAKYRADAMLRARQQKD